MLESALAWAHAHVVGGGQGAASWSEPDSRAVLWGERAVPIAGAGTPGVAEFAPMELAAALELTHESALALLGDALDLAHRLPRTWALVRDLRVPVHLGRHAAAESRDLDPAAAAHADRLLAWQPSRLNPHRVSVLVHEARLYADPDRAVADHDTALASRTVTVTHPGDRPGMTPGTSEVFMRLDTADAAAFDTTISTMATTLGVLGHPGSGEVRRAHAVGILADPQQALDLLAGLDEHGHARTDEAGALAEEAGCTPASPLRGLTTSRGARTAQVVVHVTDADLLTCGPLGRGGVARTRLGPVLMDALTSWLIGHHLTVRPVLDPTTITPVDTHDPTPGMTEAVRLRDPVCVFPGCRRPSTGCDLDHITPYRTGGPPGQTRPDALAPLCRRHHRAKTFGDFAYRRLPDGSYRWTLPTGHTVTTDPPHRRPTPPH